MYCAYCVCINKRTFFSSSVFKPRKLALAGSGLGVSYALFGLSFEKKDDEEKDELTETYRNARLAHARGDLKKADDLYQDALRVSTNTNILSH